MNQILFKTYFSSTFFIYKLFKIYIQPRINLIKCFMILKCNINRSLVSFKMWMLKEIFFLINFLWTIFLAYFIVLGLGRFQRPKLIGLKSYLHHWKNLRTQMSKMGSHDPFGYLNHKFWPKERPRIKLPIWLPTIKSWKSPWLPCTQMVCHISLEKVLNNDYTFALELISIGGLHTKLWVSKIARALILGILEPLLESPGTKWHLSAGPGQA